MNPGRRSERRSRRNRRTAFWITIGLALLALAWWRVAGRAEPPRHLLLVVFDTLRADRMSIYGYARKTTPFLESASGELLRFADVKAPAPWTVPTHASIFTGLWPAQHRAQWGRMRLAEEFETLAETLKANGFCTVALSANLLVSRSTGLDQGFDAFELVRGPWPRKSETILSRLPAAIDDALEADCRLFLFLNLMDVHIPYNARPHARKFAAEGPGSVRNARVKWEISAGSRPFSEEERRLHGAAYDAAVRYLDDVARDLLALLRERELLDETVVVLTSDHGDGLGAHPEIGHSTSLWEEQLAVPLLVRLPGGRRGGEVVQGRTTLTALMPSVLDWLRVERPEHLRQASDLEQAASEPVFADYRSYFAEQNRQTNARTTERYPELAARVRHSHALFCDRFKLLMDAAGRRRFFDLQGDPTEQIDLAPHSPPLLDSCLGNYHELLRRGLLTPFGDGGTEGDRQGSPVDLEALKSLGYVQ
ncbi:MAG: sulfatase [Thermoanaerobaculia bacterium]